MRKARHARAQNLSHSASAKRIRLRTPSSRKSFANLENDYQFFINHSSERERLIAHKKKLLSTLAGDKHRTLCRFLDFGAGDGAFTEALFEAIKPNREIKFTLVEPCDRYRNDAVARMSKRCSPVIARKSWSKAFSNRFEIIMANHVLYYVKDLKTTLQNLYQGLLPSGQLIITVASEENGLNQITREFFEMMQATYPYHASSHVEESLKHFKISFTAKRVSSKLVFEDSIENRNSILRFCVGHHFNKVSTQQKQGLLDRFSKKGSIHIALVDHVFHIAKKQR